MRISRNFVRCAPSSCCASVTTNFELDQPHGDESEQDDEIAAEAEFDEGGPVKEEDQVTPINAAFGSDDEDTVMGDQGTTGSVDKGLNSAMKATRRTNEATGLLEACTRIAVSAHCSALYRTTMSDLVKKHYPTEKARGLLKEVEPRWNLTYVMLCGEVHLSKAVDECIVFYNQRNSRKQLSILTEQD